MSTCDHSMSLIEKKKLQWAKEREELAALCSPWGPISERNIEKSLMRDEISVKDQIRRHLIEKRRRGSLPPLHKNQFNSQDRYERDKEVGGETSGYGSDNPNHTPECVQNWNQSGYESSSSRDDRPKWGDKGVGVGKFWQPKDDAMEKLGISEPPNWVKRGLQDGEIVVSNTSPAESPEQRFEENERPCTGSSYSHRRCTYIRGQNIPIDSIEMAERERRRQVAMAHQEAIRLQLEERESRRREERERLRREEQEEEMRIKREQEIERKRKEEELKQIREKQERERRRKEAIEEAIELAQKEAQMQKMKKYKQTNIINDARNTEEKPSVHEITPRSEAPAKTDQDGEKKKNNNCEQLNNTRSIQPKSENINNEIINKLEINGKGIHSPRLKHDSSENSLPIPEQLNNCNATNNNISSAPSPTPRLENNLAFILPTPLEALQTIQYALLVPATPQSVPMLGVPLTDRSCNTSRTENRILTPTVYRNKNKNLCDSSTQTEESVFRRAETSADNNEKYLREKLNNLDLTYDNKLRRERRTRSEGLEDRPKWGANRPPTRYLKQSEKDPLYQRKKMRQKIRDSKAYDDKNSSDDSQTASPRSYRKKGYGDKRHSRAHWRKNDMFTRNVRMYQTEMIPLESDKDHIYYKRKECCCMCRCGNRCSGENVKVDILKIEHNSPRENAQYKSERSGHLPDVENVNDEILERLAALHDGLLMKRDQWNDSPSTPSLSSAYRQ
ncbi:hypothetical protein JTB14_037206 [Gonioctena quinquepunctata]|nr:hypothetical protein JTB14_037206 [Gonioctena quinquepunctata]